MNPRTLFKNSDSFERFAAGTTIFQQGDPGDYMYVVIEGEVDVLAGGSYIRTLRPGDIFGEMSLMTGEKRAATVRAFSACELVEVGKDAFHDVIASDPKFVEPITRILAERQIAIEENLSARARRSRTDEEATKKALLDKIRRFFQL